MKYKTILLTDKNIDFIDGDRGKNYPSKNELKSFGHTLFLSNKNLINNYLDISIGEYISKQKDGLLRKGKLNRNDIVLTTRGSIGNVGFYSEEIKQEHIRINSGMVIIRNDDPTIYTPFLYLQLRSSFAKKQYHELSSGSVQKQLPIKDLKFLKILDVPFAEQKKISHIIFSLDKRIELNNQMIDTLEEMASALFKRWFVDFEFPDENGNPYKSSGGKMIDSELGEIPEGWEIGNLSDISEIIMGQSPKSNTYNQSKEGLPLVNGASDFKQGYIKPLKYTTDPRKVTKSDDYIFGVRATIGNVTYVDGEYAIGRGSGIARVREVYYSEYLYFTLNALFDYFTKTATGSVYINISKKDFEKYQIVIPSIFYLKKYHNTVGSLFYKIRKSREENLSLSRIRDELLPRLLSGNIEL